MRAGEESIDLWSGGLGCLLSHLVAYRQASLLEETSLSCKVELVLICRMVFCKKVWEAIQMMGTQKVLNKCSLHAVYVASIRRPYIIWCCVHSVEQVSEKHDVFGAEVSHSKFYRL